MRAKKTMSEKQLQAVSENGVAVQSLETTYKNTAEPLRVKNNNFNESRKEVSQVFRLSKTVSFRP